MSTPEKIQIRTLGQVQVATIEPVTDAFISTKAVMLFIYLAMNPGDHSRKKLAAMFWADTGDAQALKTCVLFFRVYGKHCPKLC